MAASQFQLEAAEVKNRNLGERYAALSEEKDEIQTRFEEFQAVVEECEQILEEYNVLTEENAGLKQQRIEDGAELIRVEEEAATRKLREKKLRCELRSRQLDSRWRELTVERQIERDGRLAYLRLSAEKIEFERAYECERLEKEYLRVSARLKCLARPIPPCDRVLTVDCALALSGCHETRRTEHPNASARTLRYGAEAAYL